MYTVSALSTMLVSWISQCQHNDLCIVDVNHGPCVVVCEKIGHLSMGSALSKFAAFIAPSLL
jgi:hypothetical protein